MTHQEQINAMANILEKLNDVQAGKFHKGKSNTDVNEMYGVLTKLQEATGAFTNNYGAENKVDPELSVAVNATRNKSNVSVSHYDIFSEKKIVQEGLAKTFYSIIDKNTGDSIHSDLGLFESAMGVVKHLLYTGNDQRINRILALDQEYVSIMMETYGYKHKLRRLDESMSRYDVTLAKYSDCKTKLSAVKMKLLKTL